MFATLSVHRHHRIIFSTTASITALGLVAPITKHLITQHKLISGHCLHQFLKQPSLNIWHFRFYNNRNYKMHS